MNKELFGLIEWVISNGGQIRQFNNHIVTGKIQGINFRYFITEGWVCLMTNPGSKQTEIKNLAKFQEALQHQALPKHKVNG